MKTRLAIARAAKREITRLEAEGQKVYNRVLKELKMHSTLDSLNYFFYTPNGGCSEFERIVGK